MGSPLGCVRWAFSPRDTPRKSYVWGGKLLAGWSSKLNVCPSAAECDFIFVRPPLLWQGGPLAASSFYAQASHLRAREVPKPGPAPSGVPGGASGIPWGPSGVHLGPNLTKSGSNLTQIGRHWDPIGPNIYTQTPDQPPQRTLC